MKAASGGWSYGRDLIKNTVHPSLTFNFSGWLCTTVVLGPRLLSCLLGKAHSHSTALPKIFSRDLHVYQCIRTQKFDIKLNNALHSGVTGLCFIRKVWLVILIGLTNSLSISTFSEMIKRKMCMNSSVASHTLRREEGSGHAATIKLSPW